MDIQKLTKSRFGVRLGFMIGRSLPPQVGYRLSSWFARLLARRKSSPIVQAVRKNQWVIRGGELTPQELDEAVIEVFTHAGHCFVDLYHNLQNPEGIKPLVLETPTSRELIQWSQDRSLGAFLAAPHLSNFDLCLLSLAYRGLHGQVLTYTQPTGGYEIQNNIRAQTGLDITPISPRVNREAINNMRTGGLVITGVDRPIRDKTHYLDFFGLPSPLPAGHISMAIEAEVPVIVPSASMDDQGKYHIHFSDPIPMEPHPEKHTEIKINAEKVLKVIEERVRQNPGQWLMYYPLWPEVKIDG